MSKQFNNNSSDNNNSDTEYHPNLKYLLDFLTIPLINPSGQEINLFKKALLSHHIQDLPPDSHLFLLGIKILLDTNGKLLVNSQNGKLSYNISTFTGQISQNQALLKKILDSINSMQNKELDENKTNFLQKFNAQITSYLKLEDEKAAIGLELGDD